MKTFTNQNHMRKVVAVGDDKKRPGVDGVIMDCGHWQKFPTGIKMDWSRTFINFFNGERFVNCQTCRKAK